MRKYISVRELAKILDFKVVGKLKRMPDDRYGIDGHSPLYIDEAGNEYLPSKRGNVCIGTIVDTEGRIY